MRRSFTKMHGLGNDFVVFDARAEPLALTREQVRDLADRHTGIGCDQLIVVGPSDRADAFMHIWNADGSVAEACGNAARCVATLLGEQATIDSAGGLLDAAAAAGAASIVYPPPRFEWDAVPLAYPLDTGDVPAAWDDLAHGVALSVGNPHIVFFVPEAGAVPLDTLGPRIEHDPLFPDRVNVGVAQVVAPSRLILRVWERGAGLTLACGTGAMAAAVAAIRRRVAVSPVTVSLPGGELTVAWDGGPVTLSGPAATSFAGTVEI
ncbi:MAG: diaminopimelate epimerase [Sphingomonadaceae bacterium]|nr:diaminopimelate epimerase [Sphingomonadaceae bacterium]